MRSKAWLMFWLVGLIWGSSFLLISVGVKEMSASQIAFIRTAIAAIGLNAVLFWRGRRLPTDRRLWFSLILIGFGNAVLPYVLIGLGEQTVASNVASVIQATTSLFALLIAHFVFEDERMNFAKVIGVVLGFIGVAILAMRSNETGIDNGYLDEMAIVGASLSYAIFTIYSRKVIKGQVEPLVVAAGTFIPAAVIAFGMMLIEPLLGGRPAVDLSTIPINATLSIFALGFFNTFIAYLFYYYIVQQFGASRAMMVTYVVPVIGLILGGLILNDPIEPLMIFGALLIFAGIAVVNVNAIALIERLRVRPVA